MKSKMILAVALFLLVSSAAYSQDQRTSFGIRGGVNFQNINGKDFNDRDLDFNLVTRFHAGLSVDVPIAPDFYIQPGLFFTTKGAKSEGEFLGLYSAIEYNLSYLELPIHFLYKPTLGSGHLILGFGPYVGYGIGGKTKYSLSDISTERDIDYTKEYDGLYDPNKFNPLDVGANIFFGYEFPAGIRIQINTQLGLVKINSKNNTLNNDNTSFKNTGFGLSVGYQF
jgi:hypothetical protein